MIDRLEQALARVIDGGIASVFRLGVQPADIGRRLEHALLGSRRTSMGRVIGASQFVVTLHPDEFSAFAAWQVALERELENWLGEVAFIYGVTMIAPPQVVVQPDPGIARHTIHVVSGFGPVSVSEVRQHAPVARLIPLSQQGDVVVLVDAEIAIGRAPANDVVLSAADVSREHARLRRDGSMLEVQDLGSRNGTWVNGKRISRCRAKSGDEIAFGTVRFRLDLP